LPPSRTTEIAAERILPGEADLSPEMSITGPQTSARRGGEGKGQTADPAQVEAAYQRCRELGMRLSRQRRMVLDLLWTEKSHLSARDIFEKLNDQGRHIGHTSVYQNLEALQAAGVIECLDRANGRLYGYRADPHSHLTCTQSGEILDLDVLLPEPLLRQIEAQTGFTIESYTLHLSGRRRLP
jgi:Fur family ferric uptake transcriptional regulator